MRLIAVPCAVVLTVSTALGSLTLVPSAGTTQAGNLVTNGSFEDTTGGGPPGGGSANNRLWATGTTQNFLQFAVPNGWTSAGSANTYAVWGNDGPPQLRGSDTIPHGEYAVYFGNGGPATVNIAPTFQPNGRVTFSGTPTFAPDPNFAPPCTLSQMIPTAANPAPQYAMSFWESGEGASAMSDPGGLTLGIFGFRITNVLAGDPMLYFTVPCAPDNFYGASKQYDFFFTPLNPNVNVAIEFTNWGHMDLTAYGRATATEIVMDNVIINAVPEPASLAAAGIAGLMVALRRGRRSRGGL